MKTLNSVNLTAKILFSRTKRVVSCQMSAQHFQRLLRRQLLELFACAEIYFSFHDHSKFSRQRDENCSDRFVLRAAARSGNARDRNRKIRAEFFPRTFSHFARDRFA